MEGKSSDITYRLAGYALVLNDKFVSGLHSSHITSQNVLVPMLIARPKRKIKNNTFNLEK
jgi:hypothetical protein